MKHLMIDLRTIDDLTRKLGEALPPGLADARDEVDQQIRSILTRAFEAMNLVSREEFDAQRAVLARTRQKLEELQERVDELNPTD
jgi:BMFP domain-containing protein YqiC